MTYSGDAQQSSMKNKRLWKCLKHPTWEIIYHTYLSRHAQQIDVNCGGMVVGVELQTSPVGWMMLFVRIKISIGMIFSLVAPIYNDKKPHLDIAAQVTACHPCIFTA